MSRPAMSRDELIATIQDLEENAKRDQARIEELEEELDSADARSGLGDATSAAWLDHKIIDAEMAYSVNDDENSRRDMKEVIDRVNEILQVLCADATRTPQLPSTLHL